MADKQEVISTHSINNYPPDLHKKVTLLLHFKSYLEGDGQKPMVAPVKQDNKLFQENDELNDSPSQRRVSEIVYVKKWMRTKYAVMFRLSNKIV